MAAVWWKEKGLQLNILFVLHRDNWSKRSQIPDTYEALVVIGNL